MTLALAASQAAGSMSSEMAATAAKAAASIASRPMPPQGSRTVSPSAAAASRTSAADLFERAPVYPALRRILRHCRVAPDDPSGVVAARARGEAAPRPPPRPAGKTVASDAHTALRAAQLKKPLATSPPRWPTQMTPALRRVFKANRRAVALLARFGYAGDSSW